MLDRRSFLKSGAALAVAATALSWSSRTKPVWAQAPSDRLRMGFVGVGSMGCWDAREFSDLCDVAAICDLDAEYGIARALNADVGRRDSDGRPIGADAYQDYRRLLERDDIDVVGIATPDHWHVKIAVEALQAGKHVFCQKPLTLTLEENRIIRKAVARYGKVFQIGTQQRSMRDQFALATALVRSGRLGEIERVVCDVGKGPSSDALPTMEPPANLDWDFYLGQAPFVEFRAERIDYSGNLPFGATRCHRTFRYWYEYSGGIFTDWGAHHIDCALWALGLDKPGVGPTKIDGTNVEHPAPFKDGYPTLDDRFNTAVNFDVGLELPDGKEIRVVSESPDGNGILFEGTKGRIHVNRERIKGKPFEELQPGDISEETLRELNKGKPFEGHKRNFLRCIREGGEPASDVVSHVQAMNCCHLCAISARLGRAIEWDPVAEQIVGDEQAASFQARERRAAYDIPEI